MCKSKKKMADDVIQPKPRPGRKPSSSPPSASGKSNKSSLNDRPSASYSNNSNDYVSAAASSSSFNLNTTTTTTYFKGNSSSWNSSVSSNAASLSSLKDSVLPEQPHIYNFSQICSATNNFLLKPYSSSSTSTSWRCTLQNQNVIIIQRKFRCKMEMSKLSELLLLICKSHNASVIRMKGISISGSYIYLVYDYVQGVSLSEALRNAKSRNFTVLSNWMSRIQVASDVAQGLDYIHHSTGLGFKFVHNHIKSSSIIVTEPNLHAKICHFGTAELCGEIMREELDHKRIGSLQRLGSKSTKFEGTRGYMAPEFQSSGVASQKSDVYAFGVVLLELLSGEEALRYRVDERGGGFVRISVIDTAREAMDGGGGGVRKWVDKRLKDSYPVIVVEKLVRVALECVKEDPDSRPDMGRVTGWISQLYLDSEKWAEKMGVLTDFTVSLAPR